jgi:hypothetical protein
VIFVETGKQRYTVERTQHGYVYPATGMCTVRMHFHSAILALCYAKDATCDLQGFVAHHARRVSVNPVTTIHTTPPFWCRSTSGTSWCTLVVAPPQPSFLLSGLVTMTLAVSVEIWMGLLLRFLLRGCLETAKAPSPLPPIRLLSLATEAWSLPSPISPVLRVRFLRALQQ